MEYSNLLDQWGRISIGKLEENILAEQAEDCLSYYGKHIKLMLTQKTTTWENTFQVLEFSLSGIQSFFNAIDLLSSLRVFNPSHEQVISAKAKITAFLTQHYFNRRVSLKLHDLKKNKKLTKEQQGVLESNILSYKEGFYNNKDKQKNQKVTINLEMYEAKYRDNIIDSKNNNYILLDDRSSLKNVPEEMLNQAILNSKNLGFKERFAFNLKDDTYRSLMSHCNSRAVRKCIYQQRVNLASGSHLDNNDILRNLILWRNKKAKMNGHEHFSNYATSYTSLNGSTAILTFLNNMKEHFQDSQNEYETLFKKFAKEHLKINKIFPWDKTFIKERLNEYVSKELAIDSTKFNLEKVKQEMFQLAKSLFHITLKKSNDISVWNDNCEVYEVYDNNNQLVSHIIFDIFSRHEKPDGLIFQYTVNHNLYNRDKTLTPSLQSIIMHIEKSKRGHTLIKLTDVVDLFHEFGHAMHVLMTQQKYHCHHPMTIEEDATEFPSQWFERFALTPDFISKIARRKNRKISLKKSKQLIDFNAMHRPDQYWTQILHSQVDIHLNTYFKPKGNASFHQSLAPIFLEYNQKLHKYNKFQNNQFEHFFMESKYYGYLWAEHMVDIFNQKFEHTSLNDIGIVLNKILNKSFQSTFTEQFTKVVTAPHDSSIVFKHNNDLFKSMIL